jgi:hypothetical protein
MKRIYLLLITLCFIQLHAQDLKLKGTILDAGSKEPIAGVAVYISGTSKGVVSGIDGSFTITYPEELNEPLVFSYLGYERLQIVNPRTRDLSIVQLQEQTNTLDAVVIDPDPWSRQVKERYFKEFFVGKRSLEDASILNLKKVRLRFNPSTEMLTGTADEPIIVINKHLGYTIYYDLIDFEVQFSSWQPDSIPRKKRSFEPENYRAESSFISGSSFYQEMQNKKPSKRQRERRRDRAYKTSMLKLFRSITAQTMKDDKFDLFHRGFRVDPADHIRVRKYDDVYKVTFRHLKYSVRDRLDHQTDLNLKNNFVYVDEYGNNLSVRDVQLSGFIPQLGVGGMMPLDYNLENKD